MLLQQERVFEETEAIATRDEGENEDRDEGESSGLLEGTTALLAACFLQSA